MAEHHQASAVHWEENGKGIAKAATNGDECLGPLLRCCGLANVHHLPRNSCKAGLSSAVSAESEFINMCFALLMVL